jgi:hypothetical protein
MLRLNVLIVNTRHSGAKVLQKNVSKPAESKVTGEKTSPTIPAC